MGKQITIYNLQIFVSFVAISAFLWRCFKAMSLVRIVPSQGPQIRSCILLMMDIIKSGSYMPLPYLWHSCWYCLGYCSDKNTGINGNIGHPNLYHKCACKVYWTANVGGTCCNGKVLSKLIIISINILIIHPWMHLLLHKKTP